MLKKMPEPIVGILFTVALVTAAPPIVWALMQWTVWWFPHLAK